MNREIKFRMWKEGEMQSVHTMYSKYSYDWIKPDQPSNFAFSEDEVLMQYTGLQDRNGNEIYEGDIVNIGYGIAKVIFNAGCFMIEFIDDKEAMMEWLGMYHKPHQLGRKREDVEVIGNIYGNPELVNSAENGTWKKITEEHPPVGKAVKTKIEDEKGERNEQYLVFKNNLWWFTDFSMNVNYTPTHWWSHV